MKIRGQPTRQREGRRNQSFFFRMPKTRKKKVHQGARKPHHKHKNEPMATLKYFEVGEDGSLTALRVHCPRCGPGIYMGSHTVDGETRHNCGRCGVSMTFESSGTPQFH